VTGLVLHRRTSLRDRQLDAGRRQAGHTSVLNFASVIVTL